MTARDLVHEMQEEGARQRRNAAAIRKAQPREPKTKAKRGQPEMDGQEAVISWLRKAGCTTSRNINEVQSREKDPNTRARFWFKLVKTGVTKNFPDVTALLPDGRTVFIEMKARGKTPNPDQAELHAKLEAQGHIVVWGTDIWSVQAALVQRGVVIARTGRMAVPAQPLEAGI